MKPEIAIAREKMKEHYGSNYMMAWTIAKLLTAVIVLAGGIHSECGRRAERLDRIAMQRALVGEADTVVGMRDDHDAVRRATTWSSYPARIILEWCQTCMTAQDEDGVGYSQCSRCDIDHDGQLDAVDLHLLTNYIRERFDAFQAAVDRQGATVEQLLGMGQTVTESWWEQFEVVLDGLETRLGE